MLAIEIEKGKYELITDLLRELGAKPHILGYGYIREAVMRVIENPTLLHKMTTKLYPDIARTFASTPSRTERAIRHSIELIWAFGNQEVLTHMFGKAVEDNKPTNSCFIATLAEEITVYRMGRS